MVTISGGHSAPDAAIVPLCRRHGADDHVTVEWKLSPPAELPGVIAEGPLGGLATFCDGEVDINVTIILSRDWVDMLTYPNAVEFTVELVSAQRGATLSDKRTCTIRLLPGEELDLASHIWHGLKIALRRCIYFGSCCGLQC